MGEAARRVLDFGWATHRCGARCGMPPIMGPRLRLEIEKESLLVCLSRSPSARGGESEELPHSGAGDSAPRHSPSFSCRPPFPEGGMGGEGREGSPFVPGAALRTGTDWDPAPASGSPRLRHPLHLARLSLARLLCARGAHCTQGAPWSPGPGGCEPGFPAPLLRRPRSPGLRTG